MEDFDIPELYFIPEYIANTVEMTPQKKIYENPLAIKLFLDPAYEQHYEVGESLAKILNEEWDRKVTAIDMFCGYGPVSDGFTENYYNKTKIYGVDLSNLLLKRYRKKGYKSLNTSVTNSKIINKTGEVDLIFTSFCTFGLLNHSNMVKFIQNCFKLLKKGGKVFIPLGAFSDPDMEIEIEWDEIDIKNQIYYGTEFSCYTDHVHGTRKIYDVFTKDFENFLAWETDTCLFPPYNFKWLSSLIGFNNCRYLGCKYKNEDDEDSGMEYYYSEDEDLFSYIVCLEK